MFQEFRLNKAKKISFESLLKREVLFEAAMQYRKLGLALNQIKLSQSLIHTVDGSKGMRAALKISMDYSFNVKNLSVQLCPRLCCALSARKAHPVNKLELIQKHFFATSTTTTTTTILITDVEGEKTIFFRFCLENISYIFHLSSFYRLSVQIESRE